MTEASQRATFIDASGNPIDTALATVSENISGADIAQLRFSTPQDFQFISFFVDEGRDFYITKKNELKLRPERSLDFEGTEGRTVEVRAAYLDAQDNKQTSLLTYNITVLDVDEAPSSMTLSQSTVSVPEGSYPTGRKIADITFDDDALGQNRVTIGEHRIFEVRNGNELWIKEGAVLDFETTRQHEIEIRPVVTGAGDAPAPVTLTLTVQDVQLSLDESTIGTTSHPDIVQANSTVGSRVGQVPVSTNIDVPVRYEVLQGGEVSQHFYVDSQGALRIKTALADQSVEDVELLIRAHAGGEVLERTVSFDINSGYFTAIRETMTAFQGRKAVFSVAGMSDTDGDTYELPVSAGGARRVEDGFFETKFLGQLGAKRVSGKLTIELIRKDEAVFTPDPGFIGTRDISFTILDSRGDSARITVPFEIKPEMEVTEGQIVSASWQALNLHGRSSTAGNYVEFTRLPTTGRFVLLDEAGTKTVVTVGMQIHANDIRQGWLRYEAPDGIDAATYETAHFVTHVYFNSGIVRTKSDLFAIAIRNEDGGSTEDPTGRIPLVPMLVANKVAAGTEQTIRLDKFGADSSLDLTNLSNLTFRFTITPTDGRFYLSDGNGGKTVVNGTTVIRASDVENGRLTFIASNAVPDDYVVETTYRAIRTASDGSESVIDLRLDIHIEEFLVRDKHNIGAQRNQRYVWDGASDIRFIEIGDKVIISATGADDNRSPLLDFRFDTGQLRFFNSIHDVDGWRFSNMQFSQMILHNKVGGTHFAYVTDLSGYTGIYGFSIGETGSLGSVPNPGYVISGSVSRDVAIRDIWSPTVVEFDDQEYLITSGSESAGLSVFRFETSGALTHIANYRNNISADGEHFALSGLVRGKIVKMADTTYFVGSAETNDAIVVFSVSTSGVLTFISAVRDNAQLALDQPMFSDIVNVGGRTLVAVPSFAEDAIQILELSSTGTLTSLYRINDGDHPNLNLDGAGIVKFFTKGEHTYLAAAGFHDDGISIFRFSANKAPVFIQSIDDDDKRNLDGVDGLDVYETDNGRIFMAAAGYHDDGFSIFEIITSNEVLPSTIEVL